MRKFYMHYDKTTELEQNDYHHMLLFMDKGDEYKNYFSTFTMDELLELKNVIENYLLTGRDT